jgi:hypothetical protein
VARDGRLCPAVRRLLVSALSSSAAAPLRAYSIRAKPRRQIEKLSSGTIEALWRRFGSMRSS